MPYILWVCLLFISACAVSAPKKGAVAPMSATAAPSVVAPVPDTKSATKASVPTATPSTPVQEGGQRGRVRTATPLAEAQSADTTSVSGLASFDVYSLSPYARLLAQPRGAHMIPPPRPQDRLQQPLSASGGRPSSLPDNEARPSVAAQQGTVGTVGIVAASSRMRTYSTGRGQVFVLGAGGGSVPPEPAPMPAGRQARQLGQAGARTARLDTATWEQLAQEAHEIFGLDTALVLAVIRAESSFNHEAVSSVGAQGAMQVMPATQIDLGLIDPFDPRANVYAGSQYLMELLQRFGSAELALAAYNAGPGAVAQYGSIPPYAETQNFVRKVMRWWAEGKARGGQ